MESAAAEEPGNSSATGHDVEFTDDATTLGAIYDEYGHYYHRSRTENAGRLANEFIDIPSVLSLVRPDLSGKRVLDAGCGSGIYARLLAERGARVCGVDSSRTMIEIATRETPAALGVSYSIGDISRLSFDDGFFDLAVCTFVLENVGDIAGAFREFARVTKDGGGCIISISHPIRAMASREERDGSEVWLIQDYFARGKRQSNFGSGMVVPKYRRPIEDYTEAMSSAGFAISRLLEPRPLPDGKAVDPQGYEKATRLPQLLVIGGLRMDNGGDYQK